jgi:hypothetical protein
VSLNLYRAVATITKLDGRVVQNHLRIIRNHAALFQAEETHHYFHAEEMGETWDALLYRYVLIEWSLSCFGIDVRCSRCYQLMVVQLGIRNKCLPICADPGRLNAYMLDCLFTYAHR